MHVFVSTISNPHLRQLPLIPHPDKPLTELDLMNVVADLCRFTMHEILHPRGIFFDKHSPIMQSATTKGLVNWDHHPF